MLRLEIYLVMYLWCFWHAIWRCMLIIHCNIFEKILACMFLRTIEDVTSVSWIFVLFVCFIALIEAGNYIVREFHLVLSLNLALVLLLLPHFQQCRPKTHLKTLYSLGFLLPMNLTAPYYQLQLHFYPHKVVLHLQIQNFKNRQSHSH